MRRAALLAALLAACAPASAAISAETGREAVVGRYVNREYGFEVNVPPGVRAWRPAAPAPNHGVEMPLGPGRNISVFAAFNAAGYGSSDELLASLAPPGDRILRRREDSLGGAPAVRAEVMRGGRPEVVVAGLTGAEVDDVATSVELTTTPAALNRDTRVLDRVLASYRRIPRAR